VHWTAATTVFLIPTLVNGPGQCMLIRYLAGTRMSDFGTMVTIHRANGASTTAEDEAVIKRLAKALVFGEQDRVSDYGDFNLRFGGSSGLDGSEGVMIGLTEYWVGDDEGTEGLEAEVLIERDRPPAERFAEELQEKLGPEFKVEAYCGDW